MKLISKSILNIKQKLIKIFNEIKFEIVCNDIQPVYQN